MRLYYYEGSERKAVTSVRLREMAQNGKSVPTLFWKRPLEFSRSVRNRLVCYGPVPRKEFGSNALPDPAPIKLDAELIDLTSSPELDLDANSADLTSSPAPSSTPTQPTWRSPALDLNADENVGFGAYSS